MFQILSPDTILLKWHMMLNFLQKKSVLNKQNEFDVIFPQGICSNTALRNLHQPSNHNKKQTI